MDKRVYWLGFSVFPGIGPARFHLLLQNFKTAQNAWDASVSDLKNVLGESLALKFEKFRQSFSPENYEEKLQEKQVTFITQIDPEYPKLLQATKNPPFVLYVKGDLNLVAGPAARSNIGAPASLASAANADARRNSSLAPPALSIQQAIAVVGTRKVTQYGKEVTELFTRDLASRGLTIVSGLAMGVDATAHQTTIDSGGKTIAVLGCGVDCCSPRENQNLYDEIIKKGGAIISELPLGHEPTKGSFPSRNRIIAGLSSGVLVTEGAEDSGALITADYAIQYGRPVFAVPGPITSLLSKGPYKLIQKGARLVTEPGDVVRELGIKSYESGKDSNKKKAIRGETKEEQKIIDLLQNEPLHFDEIVRRLQLDSARVGSILTLMEIKGLVKSVNSGEFLLVNTE